MENKYTFQHVAQQMIDLQDKISKDYGNAYFENLDEEDLAAARIAIGNKWRRFKNLSKQGKAEIDEKLEDTLIDLAAYALMTAQWIKNKE